jgi:uncharacterized protein YneF (UPF0154 family)
MFIYTIGDIVGAIYVALVVFIFLGIYIVHKFDE